MIYDRKIFDAFRALAVTDVSELVIGRRYYRNDRSDFTLVNLLTERKHKELWLTQSGVDIGIAEADDTEPAWIEAENGRIFSLHDSNIGASYNPWLVFENENAAKACSEMLKVTYEYDWLDDWADDFYDRDFEQEDETA